MHTFGLKAAYALAFIFRAPYVCDDDCSSTVNLSLAEGISSTLVELCQKGKGLGCVKFYFATRGSWYTDSRNLVFASSDMSVHMHS